MLIEDINDISDLRRLTPEELDSLSHELRKYIIDVISKNGGHLASSLGVVELTIALHYVFNTPVDKLIWDVGHQTYAHKILTGRRDDFPTIRKYGGISGFPKRKESPFDSYDVGHSSTSLSLALGEAVGRDISGGNNKVVAVIGDGSLTGGMAFEAINQMGHMENDLIIILNDNEHSISKNVGGLSSYLTRIITNSFYNKFRRKSMQLTRRIPFCGEAIYNTIYRFVSGFKGIIIPGQFFEDMGIRYFGPVNGHNMQELVDVLCRVRDINSGPKIVHVITKKGKGYEPAEQDPARFHGIGPFDRKTGKSVSNSKCMSYSEVAGKTLAHISVTDEKVLAITAAMKLGTGLYEFEKIAPDRFFDVGIAEQHGITFAGALASTGMKPFISIYSTFLQRAIDQLIHDIGIMDLPVKVLIDRSGVVGDDGETHHGLFDIALLRNIPNFIFLAPSNGKELRDMLYFAVNYNEGPLAIRYPRGRIDSEDFRVDEYEEFILGKLKVVEEGSNVAVFTLGDMVKTGLSVRKILGEKGISVCVVNLLSIKPLDIEGIEHIIHKTDSFITLENGVKSGGIGECIISSIDRSLCSKNLFVAGFPDEFISHGSIPEIFRQYKLDPESLSEKVIRENIKFKLFQN